VNQPFGAQPVFVPGLNVFGVSAVGGLRLSPDELTAYFHLWGRDSQGRSDLFTAKRSTPDSPFGDIWPIEGDGINTPLDEHEPTVSSDGLTLVFGRVEVDGTKHLHLATRADATESFTYRGMLQALGLAGIPFLLPDGRTLYFCSYALDPGVCQLSVSRWNRYGFDPPVPVPLPVPVPVEAFPVLKTTIVGWPVVTADDSTLYVAVEVQGFGGRTSEEVWMYQRGPTADPLGTVFFSEATPLTELSSPHLYRPTFLTGDGCRFYLSDEGYVGVERFVEKPAP
jgi:hypothetical protein